MKDRDARFCVEYMVDFDAKAAAERAGYKPATARNAAAWIHREHPNKPEVRAEIDRLIARREKRTEVTVERIEAELARIAFANIVDVVDARGNLKRDAERDDTAAVASVRYKSGDGWTEKEVKMIDKGFALHLLGKRRGMFEGKTTDNAVEVSFAGEAEDYTV